jgi:protein phosphatase 1 regulatory subunit 7
MRPQNRISDPKTIDPNLIDSDIKAGKEVLVQFSDKSYDDEMLAQLNGLRS